MGVSALGAATLGNPKNEIGFIVMRSINGAALAEIARVPANTTSWTDIGRTTGNSYSYQVLAYNAMGNSLPSNTATVTIAAALPSASLTPVGPLTFPSLTMGSVSTPQVAMLTNTGGAPLSISSIAIAYGNYLNFVQTNNCGTSLAPGASCAISATFTPKSPAGFKTSTVTVVDAAGTQTLTLNGTSLAPALASTLTPVGPLTFTSQVIGTVSAAQALTLSNTGANPLPISSIAIAFGNYLNFVQTNNCGTSLAVGASCTINVTFTPKAAAGFKTSTVTEVDAAGTHTVTLNGTAVDGAAAATLTPVGPLTFAAQTIGTVSAAQTLTLSNTGTSPLPISSIAIAFGNYLNFVQTNNCGTSLPVGGSCTINVTFTPKAAAGFKTSTVTEIDAAGTHTVTLNGTAQ